MKKEPPRAALPTIATVSTVSPMAAIATVTGRLNAGADT